MQDSSNMNLFIRPLPYDYATRFIFRMFRVGGWRISALDGPVPFAPFLDDDAPKGLHRLRQLSP